MVIRLEGGCDNGLQQRGIGSTALVRHKAVDISWNIIGR